MTALPDGLVSYIQRPDEYERLVRDLVDQRLFSPVAITSSLRGTLGMGRTTLARAVSQDPRVREAFPDGVLWTALGKDLSPLELLSRIERLIFDLSGERRGLTDLAAAEAHLRELIHHRRVLLVLDDAYDAETIRPFLQTGPLGAVLIITNQDECLPLGTRRTPVDIMMTDEAVALLCSSLPYDGDCITPGAVEPHQAGENSDRLQENAPAEPKRLRTTFIDPSGLAAVRKAESVQRSVAKGIPPELAGVMTDLAGRLNEWPLLLALINGMLRGCLETGAPSGCDNICDVVKRVHSLLDRNWLSEAWPVNDPVARGRAVDAVIVTCLEALPESDRERLFTLAVFPFQEDIHLAALDVLWQLERDETYAVCERLARRTFLTLDPAEQTIRIHPVVQGFITDHLRVGVMKELHVRLLEAYAARCPSGWASGPDDGYFFQHLAGHLVAAGRRDELQSLLFDFDWLLSYLSCTDRLTGRRGDMYSLLLDFENALSTALDLQSAELRLVQDALRLSAQSLARDPGQLAAQLLGRLLSFDEPHIKKLLEKAVVWQEKPWLRPMVACFTPPGCDEVRTLTGHNDWVTGLAILPDGQYAVSGSLDGTWRSWDLAKGQNTCMIKAHDEGVGNVAVTPDGRYVITSGWDGKVRIWALATGEEVHTINAHHEAIGAMAISPDGLRIITGADDRLIRVWDLASGDRLLELVGHGDLVRALAVTPDSRTLLSGSWDKTVRIWDLENGKQMHFLTGHEGWVHTVTISPDGYTAFSGGWDRTVRAWDMWTGENTQTLTGFTGPIFAIRITADNHFLIVGTGDGSVHFWDLASGRELHRVEGHSGGVNAIETTAGGRFAITAADDRTIRIWDLAAILHTRDEIRGGSVRPGHNGRVDTLVGLADGRHGLSASLDGTLKVWDLSAAREAMVLSGHSGGIIALAVTPDGRRAVSGSRDHTLKVWDLTSGKEMRTLPGHAGAVSAVSITPDGTCAVSGSDDGTIKVWDLETGACLASLRSENAIEACSVAHDGRTIIASEAGGKISFFEIRR